MQHADVANLFLDRFLNPTTELNAIAGAVSALRQTAAHYDSFYFSYARGYSVISADVNNVANYLDTISKNDGWRRKPSGVLAVDKIVNFVSNDKWSAGAVNNLFFTYFFNTDDFRLAKNVDITVLLAEKNDNGYLFSDALLTSFHASAAFNLHTSRLNGMNYYSMADDGPGLFSFLWGVLQNVSREVSGFAETARRLEKEDINSDGYETDSESGFAIITRDTSPAPSIWN